MVKIMVLGAGIMGLGIAQIMAQKGYEVMLHDVKAEFIEKGINHIHKNLGVLIKKGVLTFEEKCEISERIRGIGELKKELHCDLVIEAVNENLELKREIYRQLDGVFNKETIFASNTSSLSITELACCTGRPDKVIGMHFFNPVSQMNLVEVIQGTMTSKQTFDYIINIVHNIGKTPVTVVEAPGFLVNRILVPMINEAVFVLMEGSATAEDIDVAMKLGANHPIGPLALADFIGLDTCLAVMETLQKELGDNKYRPCPLLRKMVRARQLGRKTGQGFFKYK